MSSASAYAQLVEQTERTKRLLALALERGLTTKDAHVPGVGNRAEDYDFEAETPEAKLANKHRLFNCRLIGLFGYKPEGPVDVNGITKHLDALTTFPETDEQCNDNGWAWEFISTHNMDVPRGTPDKSHGLLYDGMREYWNSDRHHEVAADYLSVFNDVFEERLEIVASSSRNSGE
jgi:hypothetical protein